MRVAAACLAALLSAACAAQVPHQTASPTVPAAASPAVVTPSLPSVLPPATPTALTSPPPVPTSPAPSATLTEPDGVAFWDAERGLLVATLTTPSCRSGSAPCPGGLIERTADGGRTWQVVDRVPVPLKAVAVTGTDVAWVTSGRCAAASPDSCSSALLLRTDDAGATWTRVASATPVTSVSPVSATVAWAVAGASDAAFPLGTGLVHSVDGGHSWQPAKDPCRGGAGGLALWAVEFTAAEPGWAVCDGEPATDMQPKAIYRTEDGGASWQLQSDCLLPPDAQHPSNVGTLSCIGYLPGLQLLSDGHGWMWADRGGLASTADGGRTWTQIARTVVSDDVNSVVSASLVSDGDGYVLLNHPGSDAQCSPSACGPQLLGTRDAGVAWTVVHRWAEPGS